MGKCKWKPWCFYFCVCPHVCDSDAHVAEGNVMHSFANKRGEVLNLIRWASYGNPRFTQSFKTLLEGRKNSGCLQQPQTVNNAFHYDHHHRPRLHHHHHFAGTRDRTQRLIKASECLNLNYFSQGLNYLSVRKHTVVYLHRGILLSVTREGMNPGQHGCISEELC